MSNGGSMITGYIIEKCDEGTDKWLRCNARLCPDLFYRVCDLYAKYAKEHHVFSLILSSVTICLIGCQILSYNF